MTICRYGRPVAELAPVRQGSRTQISPELSRITITGDLTTETEWEHV